MKKLICLIITIIASFSSLLTGCSSSSEISIYAPDGAPALALSSLIKADLNKTTINVVASDKIASCVTGKNSKADVCILPINMASNLLGNGENYKMIGTITHGNFYFLSKADIVIDKQNINSLIGKTIGVMQLQNVPGLTFKYTLNSLGVNYITIQDVSEKQSDKVNLMAINKIETARTDIDVFLIPSPQADLITNATNLNLVGSLGALYSLNGFPQAVIVVKNEVLENNLATIKQIASQIKNVNDYLIEENFLEICTLINSKLESGLTPVFNENTLTPSVIQHLQIKYVSCKNSQEDVSTFINNLKTIEPNSVKTFNSNFFYLGDLWQKTLLKTAYYILY